MQIAHRLVLDRGPTAWLTPRQAEPYPFGDRWMSKFDWTSRRNFLVGLASVPISTGLAVRPFGARQQSPPTYSSSSPYNRAFDFQSLNSWIVPNDEFYTRSHFPVPRTTGSTWTVTVDGAVDQVRSFTLDDIKKLPFRELPVTLECAGNLVGYGGVSNARWGGVSLGTLLRAAGVKSNAVEVILSGADGGPEREANGLQIDAFARGIPVAKALDVDTVLAYQMNGEALPSVHGGPLRAIVPGWYGMDSVKWINRVWVSREPFSGFYQTKRYFEAKRVGGTIKTGPLHEMRIKSQLARPRPDEALLLSRKIEIAGAAWGSSTGIQRVDLSFDGARSWQPAALDEEKAPYAWRIFRFQWQPSRSGTYEIVARATDGGGRQQPMSKDPDILTPYANNWCDRKIVSVSG